MDAGRSRLAMIGVAALAICVALSLFAGTAESKKKKGGKSGKVTVSKTTPTAIPVAPTATGPESMTTVPLTVGKKGKNKVVGWDSVSITTTFTGSTADALSNVTSELTAPNGRTVFLLTPVWNPFPAPGVVTSGPLTETPDSPFNACFPDATHPCPGGLSQDPESTVGPPYAGTIGDSAMSHFGGVPAKGTWTYKVFNSDTTTSATLNSVSLAMTLKNAPL